MIGLVRALSVCAALAFGLASAHAADKAFKRDDLADSAIRLEAQIKTEAGIINKTAATLKSDTDAAFKRGDLRGVLQLLGQTAAVAPEDSGNWLRLAKTIFQIGDPLADRRLHDMQAACRISHAAGLDHSHEITKLAKIHCVPVPHLGVP